MNERFFSLVFVLKLKHIGKKIALGILQFFQKAQTYWEKLQICLGNWKIAQFPELHNSLCLGLYMAGCVCLLLSVSACTFCTICTF
jgi:hypothetical protein